MAASETREAKKANNEPKTPAQEQEEPNNGDPEVFAVKRPTPVKEDVSDTESDEEDTPTKRARVDDEVPDENVDNFLTN